MDITWYGQSCFKIKGKTGSIVIDPFDPEFTGLKLPKDLEASVVLVTHNHPDHNFTKAVLGSPLIVNGPGEYEKSGITINGFTTYHDKSEGSELGKNTVYHIFMDDINIVHLGDLAHKLTEEQISAIESDINILMIPVGGVHSLNEKEAAEAVADLEPRVVIPMHYSLPGHKFESELGRVDKFLKEMGAESIQPQAKLSITKDKLPEETTVVVLSKQS